MRSADLLKLCETLWNYIFPPRVDAAFLRTLIEPQRSQPKLGTHLSLTSNMWRGVDPSSRQGMRRKFVGSEIKWSWPFRVKHEGSKTQVFSNTCKETCQMYPNVFKCPDLLLSLSLYVCAKSEWTDLLSLALDHHAAVFEGGDSVAAGRSAEGAELRIHKDLSWNESSKTIISAASSHHFCGESA